MGSKRYVQDLPLTSSLFLYSLIRSTLHHLSLFLFNLRLPSPAVVPQYRLNSAVRASRALARGNFPVRTIVWEQQDLPISLAAITVCRRN